jgi:hypothetical protein
MKLATDITEPLDQCLLNVHVNVFQLNHQGELATFDGRPDFPERLDDLFTFLAGKNTCPGEHPRMGDRCTDIMGSETVVKADAFGESVNAAVRRLAKDS